MHANTPPGYQRFAILEPRALHEKRSSRTKFPAPRRQTSYIFGSAILFLAKKCSRRYSLQRLMTSDPQVSSSHWGSEPSIFLLPCSPNQQLNPYCAAFLHFMCVCARVCVSLAECEPQGRSAGFALFSQVCG